MTKRILIVEDERDIAELAKLHLQDLDASVTLCADGRAALALAQSQPFDLLILDLNLPGLDGLEVCRRVRASGAYVPILMLTARSGDADRILGLEMGADDYLTKPFNVLELVARVKALFRRVQALAGSKPDEERIRNGELDVDLQRREVTVRGAPVHLTAKEFELLVYFCRHPGRVYTREQLLQTVWGTAHRGYEHTVNSHINRLRAKIERDPAAPEYILTVWGVGYKFADTAARADAPA
jgi:DNA-binding response OmpR family regulator